MYLYLVCSIASVLTWSIRSPFECVNAFEGINRAVAGGITDIIKPDSSFSAALYYKVKIGFYAGTIGM